MGLSAVRADAFPPSTDNSAFFSLLIRRDTSDRGKQDVFWWGKENFH